MATTSTSEDGDELQCSNNPSYEVMRLHRPTPNQTGSDERDIVSDTYASVQWLWSILKNTLVMILIPMQYTHKQIHVEQNSSQCNIMQLSTNII